MNQKKYRIAVIGATGSVGREVLNTLPTREFPIEEVIAVASEESNGTLVSFDGKELIVQKISQIDFSKIDIAFFCAGAEISQKYAKIAADQNCIVIDKSAFFRMNEDVPLIVPEVNNNLLKDFKNGIISNPNCVVIPLCAVLKPLDNLFKIKRVVASTYQSVSGAGKDAMDELYNQTKAKYAFDDQLPRIFPKQIAFNLIPQIGEFNENGDCDEEEKIQEEFSKILGDHAKITVTTVRVPVFVSHSISVNVEFEENINAEEAEEILREADGLLINSKDNEIKYMTPTETTCEDEVFVSRIRDDSTKANTINMWICCDNLRKGAALNAVQIAEELIGKGLNNNIN